MRLIDTKSLDEEMRYLLFLIFIVGLAWSHVVHSPSEKSDPKLNDSPKEQQAVPSNNQPIQLKYCPIGCDYVCSMNCIDHGWQTGTMNTQKNNK